MPDPNKKTPPPGVESLTSRIAFLPDAEKQLLKHCRETGTTPPPHLVGILEAIRVADATPEGAAEVDTALQFDPVDPAEDADGNTPRDWAYVFCLLEKPLKAKLAAAIVARDTTGAELTEKGDRFIFDVMLKVIVATEKDPRTREVVAGAFGVTLGDLQAVADKRIAERKAAAEVEQGTLPGFEPTTAEIVEQTEAELITGLAVLNRADQLGRGVSKLDRRLSYIRPTGENNIAFAIGNKEIKLRLNPPPTPEGKPQFVLPYDQEVDATATNIFNSTGQVCTVSVEQFFRAMNGTRDTDTIGEAAIKDILTSIRKLKKTFYTATATDGKTIAESEPAAPVLMVDILKSRKVGGKREKFYLRIHRAGLISSTDWAINGYQSYAPEILNIAAGYWRRGAIEEGKGEISATQPTGRGWELVKISFTPLSITIRKYLLMEIHRLKATPSLGEAENKITYDAVFKYEADPALVVYDDDGLPRQDKRTGSRELRTPTTPAEKKTIEKKRKHRRELVLAILGHFQATGLVTRFREVTEGRRKVGVIVEAAKTDPTLKRIEATTKRRRLQTRKE